MIYFVNNGLQLNSSGIEHAEYKRLHLFRNFDEQAKILTKVYNPDLHLAYDSYDINNDEAINMYDFFMGTDNYKERKLSIAKAEKKYGLDVMEKRPTGNNDGYDYYIGDRRIVWMNIGSDGYIKQLQNYDIYNNLISVDLFDSRGFLACEQSMDQSTGQLTHFTFFDTKGHIVIEQYGQKNNVQCDLHYQGDHHFDSLNEMFIFFMDQLFQDDDQLIVDRSFETMSDVFQVRKNVKIFTVFHNDHHQNNNFLPSIRNLDRLDGVVILTQQQLEDIQKEYPSYGKFYRIPGPIVPNEQLNKNHIPMNQREHNLVVVMARLAKDKQQDQLVQIWSDVLKEVPDAHLELWGYGNEGFEKEVQDLIIEKGLQNSIQYKGYTSNPNKIYDRAQLAILPSRGEGLPLSLVEETSHGLPIVANDIKYGPSDVINNHKSGILTELDNLSNLKDAIIEILFDEKKKQVFSDQAYEESKRYSEKAVWQLYKSMLNL